MNSNKNFFQESARKMWKKQNDKIKELKLKKKRKQIELQNAINEKKTFDFYNANLEKAKELMGKFVLKNYRLKSQLLRLFLIIVCSEEFKIFIFYQMFSNISERKMRLQKMIDEKKLKKEHEKRKKTPLNEQLNTNIMLVHCSFLLATFKILYL